jgi:hypothetical protein
LPLCSLLPSTRSYTTTGSFSRSAVNNSVGAQTPLAQIVTGFTVMLVLLCLTGVFENMSANVQVSPAPAAQMPAPLPAACQLHIFCPRARMTVSSGCRIC